MKLDLFDEAPAEMLVEVLQLITGKLNKFIQYRKCIII